MNTINTISNSLNPDVQNNAQTSKIQSAAQDSNKIHHHHHKNKAQDSMQISNQNTDQSAVGFQNPLDTLVSNGTITKDQESAIENAFLSARQAMQTGTYDSTQTNPISSLTSDGTITQDQANSIINAFRSIHHNNMQQAQNSAQPANAASNTQEVLTEAGESSL